MKTKTISIVWFRKCTMRLMEKPSKRGAKSTKFTETSEMWWSIKFSCHSIRILRNNDFRSCLFKIRSPIIKKKMKIKEEFLRKYATGTIETPMKWDGWKSSCCLLNKGFGSLCSVLSVQFVCSWSSWRTVKDEYFNKLNIQRLAFLKWEESTSMNI